MLYVLPNINNIFSVRTHKRFNMVSSHYAQFIFVYTNGGKYKILKGDNWDIGA